METIKKGNHNEQLKPYGTFPRIVLQNILRTENREQRERTCKLQQKERK